MAKSKTSPIDRYLSKLGNKQRAALEKLRKTIKDAARAFYLFSGSTVDAHKADLKNYDTSKGTIRFPADQPLPASLVRRLVKARIDENAAR